MPLFFCTAVMTKMSLLQDLSLVLLVAGVVATLFHYLGWPKVIGYIAAGALMCLPPIRSGMISNEESVKILANLGIIFLMFNLGLELNIKQLKDNGVTVFPAAAFDVCMMVFFGYAVAHYILGWGIIPSLFMGAVVCDSSTTLLAKSLSEMHCEKERFASVIFGITITQDIVTIAVMAILTGLAITGQVQTNELGRQLLNLCLFLVGVMVFGLLLLPKLLNTLLRKLEDDETLLLIVIGICFGISLVAERLQFSLALGSFLIGAVVNESRVRRRIRKHTMGLRTVFSAVFFVTIGMMADIPAIWEAKWLILLFVLVVLVGKTLNNMLVSFMTGQTFREAFQIGFGMAQLGDFAYLVALLGMTLQKNAPPYPQMYQIAVGVSIITTLINPFLLKHAGGFADWLESHFPKRFQDMIRQYTLWFKQSSTHIQTDRKPTDILRPACFVILSLLSIAVIFVTGRTALEMPSMWKHVPRIIHRHCDFFVWCTCSFLACPLMAIAFYFFRIIAIRISDALIQKLPVEFEEDERIRQLAWEEKTLDSAEDRRRRHEERIALERNRQGGWYRRARLMLRQLLTIAGLFAILFAYGSLSMVLFPRKELIAVMAIALIALCYHTRMRMKKIAVDSQNIFTHMIDASENDVTVDASVDIPATVLPPQHIESKITIPDNSPAIGRSLKELQIRNYCGVTVVAIRRQGSVITSVPGPDDILLPFDVITVLGTDEQIKKTREFLG